MNIQGFQKLTLLDYPETLACTIFTGGCNFRCPYCHNASLVVGCSPAPKYSMEEIFVFLRKRKNVLKGVCISGGEPMLQPDLDAFIYEIKAIGYKVKLDTNGSFPDRLVRLAEQGLLDYVAMDIKNSKEGYAKASGVKTGILEKVQESVAFLMENKVAYEFRTTVVDGLHHPSDFVSIGRWIEGAPNYYLQNFVDSGDLIEKGMKGVPKEMMESYMEILKPYIPSVKLRGL